MWTFQLGVLQRDSTLQSELQTPGPKTVDILSLSHVLPFCDLMDSNLPCSSVHGILQAKILEWVAISFSRGSS